MEKIEWYQFQKLSKEKRDSFIGIVTDDKNIVHAYTAGEERKFKTALKKIKDKQDAETILS